MRLRQARRQGSGGRRGLSLVAACCLLLAQLLAPAPTVAAAPAAETVEVCTGHGLETVPIPADQPAPAGHHRCDLCILCQAGGHPPAALCPTLATLLLEPYPAQAPPRAGHDPLPRRDLPPRPPSRAPPLPTA